MDRVKRLFPDALAGRIVLLLAIALLAANAIALVVLGLEQRRFGRQAGEDRVIARTADLVTAMEAVDAQTRRIIARDASSPFARVRVAGRPLLSESGSDTRSALIAARLADALGRGDARVAITDRRRADGPVDGWRRPAEGRVIAITVPLSPRNGRPQWLNVVTRDASAHHRVNGRPFVIVLALSLLGVLGVALLVARHLTKPLGDLSRAAQAAGRGDRTARVPETGPREMREAARAFNTMQAEISQFDAERMRMLAAVGHDLRTPMTSLRIRAEMVDDAEQRDAMIRTLDAMTVMADGLVTYAKEGREAEKTTAIDLGALLRDVCADRDVPCDVAPGIRVNARRVSLGRALGNLIDNAIRYGGDPVVSAAQDKRNAIVTIEDSGPGIPPDDLDAMFQPFTRGEGSRNLDTGGAGLGLSIARMTIIAHSGEITLENRDEGGLRARVVLPLAA